MSPGDGDFDIDTHWQRNYVRKHTLLAGQSAQTAHEHSKPLGWAEIQHPFHPLRGQSFPVLKKRRVSGVDTLILQGLEHGTFCVHREWTDWADPCPYVGLTPPRLNIYSLLELVDLLEQVNLAHQEYQHLSTCKGIDR